MLPRYPLHPDEQAPLTSDDHILLDLIRRRRIDLVNHPAAGKLRIRQASMGAKTGRVVYRVTKAMAAKRILEIGTCVGIGAAYFARAAVQASDDVFFVGTEGNAEKKALADETLDLLADRADWRVVLGDFDETLEDTIAQYAPFDLVYIDGQHEGKKTIRNWEWAIAAMPVGGIVLADDLEKPRGMPLAEKHFNSHPRVERRCKLGKLWAYEIGTME